MKVGFTWVSIFLKLRFEFVGRELLMSDYLPCKLPQKAFNLGDIREVYITQPIVLSEKKRKRE